MDVTKCCMKCSVEKPIVEFYKHSRMSDGRLNKCKACTCEDVRANRAARLSYYREYDKARDKLINRKAYKADSLKRWSGRNPEKASAHCALNNALRDGKLTKSPCEECGAEKVEAHHDDYSKPLEVRWLCKKHHMMVHGRWTE